jgi:Bacterial regulatory proteins, tetR family.
MEAESDCPSSKIARWALFAATLGYMDAMSLRDVKRAATARALATAAFGLALERGLDHFTIDDVVRVAGYSRRTFANHYSCKEEAVTAVAVARLRDTLETFPPQDPDLSPLDWLQELARHQLSGGVLELLIQLRSLADDHPTLEPYLYAVQQEIRELALDALLRRVGSRASELYPYLLVGAAYGAMTAIVNGRVPLIRRESLKTDIGEFVTSIFAQLRRGF